LKKATIVIQDVSIGYSLRHGKRKLVKDGISLELYEGEVTCLLGANGSGKSTLLRTLAGFQPALKGNILYNNKSLSSYSDAERSLLIGLVLTDKIYAGGISVFDLVSLGRHPHTGFFGSLKQHDKEIILDSMKKTGILHKAGDYVSELSDGERQKAMIAKALAQECPVILLDEPTAFLDIGSRIEMMYLLKELAIKERKSILLSTHDIEIAIRLGDRFWLMDKSLPFISGIPGDLIANDIFSRFFDKQNIQFDKQTGTLRINRSI
jgi:iron complex transport system ATP-binding protein